MTPPPVPSPRWPWQRFPRESAIAVLGSAGALLVYGAAVSAMPRLDDGGQSTPPLISPAAPVPVSADTAATELRDVAPAEAMALNAKIPLDLPAAAARPFFLGKVAAETRAQALNCLTDAVYYEAGQESDDGQRAVAQVVLNRVRHPAFPNSVCGVVFQGSTRATGCQFTFTCDGSLARAPMPAAWDRARRNATALLDGDVDAAVGTATHYHANYVVPYWAPTLTKTQVIGAHLFYRWAGNWGLPTAFSQRYGAREGDSAQLRRAALSVAHTLPRVLMAAGNAAAALDKLAGVEVKAAGGRVTAHFSPAARAAVEKVKVVPYVDRVAASDNLRYALGDDAAQPAQAALGTSAATAETTASH